MTKFLEVHTGTTRMVFLIGKYAFKIPVLNSWRGFLKGLLANSNERSIWHLCPDYFLPVLWSLPGGWLVCMPRARTYTVEGPMYRCFMADLTHPDNDDNDQALTARRYCEAFWKNIGWYKGRPICIDYGTYVNPDSTEDTFNTELTYYRIKTKRLVEEQEDVPYAPPEEAQHYIPVNLNTGNYAMDMAALDIPAFTAKPQSVHRFEDHGVLDLEEGVQGATVWGPSHPCIQLGIVDNIRITRGNGTQIPIC